MNIAIIGPNCAGKTTCAKRIAKEFGLLRFSLGQMIKDSIRNHTLLGLMAHPYVTRGNFIPDEVANAALEEKVSANTEARGFVFDGFP
jgi:adenylate kinase